MAEPRRVTRLVESTPTLSAAHSPESAYLVAVFRWAITPSTTSSSRPRRPGEAVADRKDVAFGIREVTSSLDDRARRLFKVNGKRADPRRGWLGHDAAPDPRASRGRLRYVKRDDLKHRCASRGSRRATESTRSPTARGF